MTNQRRTEGIIPALISSLHCLETEEMLLKGSFSKARALLKDTLHSVKSFFSGGYQRLPKTLAGGDAKHLHRSFRELDNFFDCFSQQWEISTTATQEKKKKQKRKKKLQMIKEKDEDVYNGSFMGLTTVRSSEERQQLQAREDNEKRIKRRAGKEEEEEEEEEDSFSQDLRVELCCTLAEGLKKLEQLDARNVEHVVDIEEVLHYYSRIKCPIYVDIFNSFFMEMYAEFLPLTSGSCHFCRRRNA
ncbi:uncharacterized protein [Aristolochia californica]|uniref:uncharacterized protein n=1 Tax=Aristolochia californica TaxID=171875 RepID=UPI0035D67076